MPGLKQPGREITTRVQPFMRLRIREIIQAGQAIELSRETAYFLTRRLLQKDKKYRTNGKFCAWSCEPFVRILCVVSARTEVRQQSKFSLGNSRFALGGAINADNKMMTEIWPFTSLSNYMK